MASIDPRMLDEISCLIYDKVGIHLTTQKNYLLESKLVQILSREGYADLASFYKSVKSGDSRSFDILVRYITTGHTFFFRESDHFRILSDELRNRKAADVLIWCSACSTGEEVYSIVISLLEQGARSFRLIASDINLRVLSEMNRGVYHVSRFEHMNKALRLKYFVKLDEDHYRIRPDLRHFVSIKRLNLIEPIRFEKEFDYIFCRNVLIYFDEKTRANVIAKLTDNLKPNGMLFLGLTENLLSLPRMLKKAGSSVYRKTV